jgi:hypothetical protein
VAPIQNIDERLAATGTGDFSALVAAAETAWENRGDLEQCEAAIASWEEALTAPTEGDRGATLVPVLTSLSRAYYFHAFYHLGFQDGDPDQIEAAQFAEYAEGIEVARLALSVNNPNWNRALLYETPIPEAVQVLTHSDVPTVYWYSVNMGRWALIDGTPTILAHKDDIAAIMTRMAELDASYFYGASDRYFGVFYTRLPIGNPDLEASLRHFESAIAMAPDYLSTRVLFAGDYAPKVQNRELFIEQLEYVIAADLGTLPEVRAENEIEQRRAQELLDNVDEYFR